MNKTDFFIGKRNKDIVNRTKELGFEKVIFVKEVSSINEIRKEDKKEYDAILIKTKSPELSRRMVDKASYLYPLILVLGTTDIINRSALEHKKVHSLVNPEYNRNYDYMNYRNSGLNHVLCKIAKDQNKKIIFSFSEILNKHGEERAFVIGKIMQNIMICKKYKTETEFYNLTTKKEDLRALGDIKSFFKVLGAN